MYADTRKWIKAGWIDYIMPQIYFTTKFDKVPFKTTTDWWINNSFGRHLYIGQGAYRVGSADRDATWSDPSELPTQMRFLRSRLGVSGSVFFSSKSLINNKLGLSDSLRQQFYKYIAFQPTMPWKDATPCRPVSNVQVNKLIQGFELFWSIPAAAQDGDIPQKFAIYRFDEHESIDINDIRYLVAVTLKAHNRFIDQNIEQGKNYTYVITGFDKLMNESEGVSISTKK
jgi:Glycosyl hydrolase-like 10